MIVEIKGAGFVNKGAELLLRSCLRLIYENFGDDVLIVRSKNANFEEDKFHKELKLGSVEVRSWKGLIQSVVIRDSENNSIQDGHIDLILDVSGYLYCDFWGARAIWRNALYYKYWRNRGCKIVLLPQALGPFDQLINRTLFRYLAKQVEVIYARDQESYDIVKSVIPASKLHSEYLQDITFILDSNEVDFSARDGVGLVISEKFYRNKSDIFLLLEVLRRHNFFSVKVFCFDSLGDAALTRFLLEELESQSFHVQDFSMLNGIESKKELSKCTLVVSSRYHAIVSALSCAVPVVATSWSHKYETLLAEFRLEHAVAHRIQDLDESLEIIKESLFNAIWSVNANRIKHNVSRCLNEESINSFISQEKV